MMMDYYDLVLGLIPLSILGVAAGLVGIGVGLLPAVSAGALVSTVLIGHAMFVRAPVGPVSASPPAEQTQPTPGRSGQASDSPVNAAD